MSDMRMGASAKGGMSEAVSLAFDVLGISRQLLFVRMRFLEPAFYKLKPVVDYEGSLCVDGEELRFSPVHIISRYLQDEALVGRDYLHAVFHCVFAHPFVSKDVIQPYWNLACDIAVESLITSLDLDAVRSAREYEQEDIIGHLREDVGTLTAERIYRYLVDAQPSPLQLEDMQRRFYADDHTPWFPSMSTSAGEGEPSGGNSKEQDDEAGGGSGGSQAPSQDEDGEQDGEQEQPDENTQRGGDSRGDDGEEEQEQEDAAGAGPMPSPGGGDDQETLEQEQQEGQGSQDNVGDDAPDGSEEEGAVPPDESGDDDRHKQTQEDWKNIAERMQVELETMGKTAGVGSRDLVEAIRALNRQSYDYEEFLRRFAVPGEVMQINDDEFDYIYYTYGLTLYENMPLIEPLEYKEVNRINEFVIAIDTSASVKGDQVQAFIEKTFNILKSTESFFTEVKIYIVQCDSSIKDVQVITSIEDADEVVSQLKLHGFGGTDFRPVFAYVDDLVDKKVLSDLKGLIYFTDGFGEYPVKMPNYKTAFVFVDDGQINPNVPSWAIKLILNEGDL